MSSLRTNLAFAAGLVLLPSMAFARPGWNCALVTAGALCVDHGAGWQCGDRRHAPAGR